MQLSGYHLDCCSSSRLVALGLLLISLLQFGLQFDGFLRALGGQLMLPGAFEIFRAQSFPLDSKVQAFDG